ncbi:MAG: hypothetical protein K0R19_2144 [Bacillota bacterium]|jgi:broad specificity phosphatase PhoE|nr:hypothetical protein [Bacillota bacterium]
MGKIHLIRHGTTEANKTRKYYGSTDLPLANEGVDEVSKQALAGIYPKSDGALLFTTGLVRTEQTFFLIYGCKEHQVIPELQEYRFGAFEMKTHDELEHDMEYQKWMGDDKGMTPCPGGESPQDFRCRVGEGFARILEFHRGDGKQDHDIILVCHGGVISLVMGTCFPEAEKNIFEWQPEPGRGYSIHTIQGSPVSYEMI